MEFKLLLSPTVGGKCLQCHTASIKNSLLCHWYCMCRGVGAVWSVQSYFPCPSLSFSLSSPTSQLWSEGAWQRSCGRRSWVCQV